MKITSIKKMKKAVVKIQQAIELFDEVDKEELRFYDAAYYAKECRELISCDEGEAGLLSLIQILESKKGI